MSGNKLRLFWAIVLVAAFAFQSGGKLVVFAADVQTALMFSVLVEIVLDLIRA